MKKFILLFIPVIFIISCNTNYEKKWKELKEKRTIESLEAFIESATDSIYIDSAKSLIEELYWENATGNDSIMFYIDYVKSYPSGKFIKQAMKQIKKSEKKAWNETIIKDTKEAYNSFIELFPKSKYADTIKLITEYMSSDKNFFYINQSDVNEHTDEIELTFSENNIVKGKKCGGVEGEYNVTWEGTLEGKRKGRMLEFVYKITDFSDSDEEIEPETEYYFITDSGLIQGERFYYKMPSKSDKENYMWKCAKIADNRNYYSIFADTYPNAEQTDTAKIMLGWIGEAVGLEYREKTTNKEVIEKMNLLLEKDKTVSGNISGIKGEAVYSKTIKGIRKFNKLFVTITDEDSENPREEKAVFELQEAELLFVGKDRKYAITDNL